MASKLPKSVARIPIPLYGGTVWFAQSIEDTRICASLIGVEAFEAEGWSGITYGGYTYQRQSITLVGLKDLAVDVLAHEMAHVAMGTLGNAGVVVTPKDDEAFCYLLQHLMAKSIPYLKA